MAATTHSTAGARGRLTISVGYTQEWTFFAGDTPVDGPVPSDSGLAQWLASASPLTVALRVTDAAGEAVDRGTAEVDLAQLKSGVVNLFNSFTPLDLVSRRRRRAMLRCCC